jgi:hypothetical protein
MKLAVTICACRQFYARGALQIFPAMCTHGMFGEQAGMTVPTVHRIEPAPVPSVVGADVAVEAFREAVRAALEVSHIDVVAEQQAGDEHGQEHAQGNVVACGSRSGTAGARQYVGHLHCP